MARPTKYKPEFCEAVVKAGEAGGTIIAMAEACDVDRHTLQAWTEKHPEFSTAVKRGLQKAQALWESLGLEGAQGKVSNFNATSYIFNMKNRFKDDWRDKVETEHSGAVAITEVVRKVERPNHTNG